MWAKRRGIVLGTDSDDVGTLAEWIRAKCLVGFDISSAMLGESGAAAAGKPQRDNIYTSLSYLFTPGKPRHQHP